MPRRSLSRSIRKIFATFAEISEKRGSQKVQNGNFSTFLKQNYRSLTV
jgi:hypothetical protein